jgi:hypothetical protein
MRRWELSVGLVFSRSPLRAALRGGDFEGLLAVLDPDLVVRTDLVPTGAPAEVRGAAVWAKGAVAYGHMARLVQPALVNGPLVLSWRRVDDCPGC